MCGTRAALQHVLATSAVNVRIMESVVRSVPITGDAFASCQTRHSFYRKLLTMSCFPGFDCKTCLQWSIATSEATNPSGHSLPFTSLSIFFVIPFLLMNYGHNSISGSQIVAKTCVTDIALFASVFLGFSYFRSIVCLNRSLNLCWG